MCDEGSDCTDISEFRPGERWPPVGANELDDETVSCGQNDCRFTPEEKRLRDLEEQHESLNSALISLTTHFAQVQFRLRQIVETEPGEEKEKLLKDLEAFAFRGIPDAPDKKLQGMLFPPYFSSDDFEEKMRRQREKQKELISQLKTQLEDLEKYAYETGEAGLPQSVLMERQKIIIDQLKGKLNLNVDDMSKLTVDDIRSEVDQAISKLINPLKMKENLVMQLKTQISDLERFIEFLQGEGTPEVSTGDKECVHNCPVHCGKYSSYSSKKKYNFRNRDDIREETINIMKKAASLLHMFAALQFGCGTDKFRKNSLKRTVKANHWGDLRARLELAVDEVLSLILNPVKNVDADYMSDSDHDSALLCNAALTSAVRKKLAVSVKDLLQHGLMPIGQSVSVVPFIACFPQTSEIEREEMHAWELILKYYELKNGEKYNSTPARKLSQSFNLDIVGGNAISNKQSLLSVIGNIIVTHAKYKRSYDSHLKAFICAALNAQKLVTWLRLILRCQKLVDMYYQSWSYVVKTGFEDSFQSLDRLSRFKFDLPVDLAVRQLQNIKDAF
ncbi:RUN domain-containing protein 1 [Schistocerca serialis cubense]|uniref:RUN domain-containing protein 1 n=1 Tax=Schistocerca serialis cubense TaxID=2023355 RepID=UPI00214E296B|nr:RUN domain-containing protein 1 [Schistocerca serialis cubense]